MDEQQQQNLQSEVIQLKARLLDAKDNLDSVNAIMGRVAQAAGYEGHEANGLIQAIEALSGDTKGAINE